MSIDAYKKIRGVEFTVGKNRQHIAEIQEAFIRELFQRFEKLRGAIRSKVGYENDFFGLKQDAVNQTGNIQQTFFRRWLFKVFDRVLGLNLSDREAQHGKHFTAKYIQGAAIQGFNQATGQLFQVGISINNPDNERVQELVQKELRGPDGRYIAPIQELRQIKSDMAEAINAILDEGFDEGWNPQKMADRINEEIREIERTRAAVIARTETSFSHAQQTVKRYQDAGVDGIAHVGRMITPDESLCPWCRAIADTTFTLEEFLGTRVLWRGQKWFVGVPAHPSGRCAPVPKPGVSNLPPIEERLPEGAEVIASGFDMFSPSAV